MPLADSSEPSLIRRLSFRDYEFDDGAPIQRLMVSVYEGNLGLVRPRRKASDDDRAAAGVGPDPLRAINRDMSALGQKRTFALLIRSPHWRWQVATEAQ